MTFAFNAETILTSKGLFIRKALGHPSYQTFCGLDCNGMHFETGRHDVQFNGTCYNDTQQSRKYVAIRYTGLIVSHNLVIVLNVIMLRSVILLRAFMLLDIMLNVINAERCYA
jgi:hypothetical protein